MHGVGKAGVETLQGLGGLIGYNPIKDQYWDGEHALQSWAGMAQGVGSIALMASPVMPLAPILGDLGVPVFKDAKNTVDQMGKGLLAWDDWSKNPAEAAGKVLFNVGTIVIPGVDVLKGVSVLSKVEMVANAISKVDRIAADLKDLFPGGKVPHVEIPNGGVHLPDGHVPGSVTPHVDLPEAHTPTVTTPHVDAPDAHAPATDTTQLAAPSGHVQDGPSHLHGDEPSTPSASAGHSDGALTGHESPHNGGGHEPTPGEHTDQVNPGQDDTGHSGAVVPAHDGGRLAGPSDSAPTGHHLDDSPILRNGEQFNPDGTLKPNVRYQAGEHEYIYTTDEHGYISSFHADELQLKLHDGRLRHDPNTPGKLEDDHAGHLAGDLFGGSKYLDNLVSQLKDVNLSTYRKIEIEWAKALDPFQPGGPKHVSVDVHIQTDAATGRPVQFEVQYTIGNDFYEHTIPNN